MKIVINRRYGGFGLSEKAEKAYCREKGIDPVNFAHWEINRNDPVLIELVEKMGKDAAGNHADLKVVDIPDDVDWVIDEYDGMEWVAEKHRTWS